MFWKWLKGIIANILFWCGIGIILFELYTIGNEGLISQYSYNILIIGIVMGLVGSYLKYEIKNK